MADSVAGQGKVQDEPGPSSGIRSKEVFRKYGGPSKGRRAHWQEFPMAKEGTIRLTNRLLLGE